MTDAMGLLGLLWLFLLGRQQPSSTTTRSPTAALPPPPAPWPAALPAGLPAFPGPGWEYDEPPPAPVQQRAKQLVSSLWKRGRGSHQTEQTAGRWITYRAEIVRGGKQGVTAWRLKGAGTLRELPRKDEARAPSSPSSPSSPVVWTLPAILTAASPGWPQPQPQAGGGYVDVVAGLWYQWTGRVDVSAGIADPKAFAEGIARGLSGAGAVNIAVSADGPPFVVAYQLKAKQSVRVPLGVAIGFHALGVKASITFLSGKEIPAPDGPKVPMPPESPPPKPAEPPGYVMTSEQGPAPGSTRINVPGGSIDVRNAPDVLSMPDLKFGDGLKPKAPVPEVAIVQRKLGLPDDGRFGRGTQTAVIEFQRKVGLAPNLSTEQLRSRGFGAVKRATWVALFGGGVAPRGVQA